MKLAPTALLCAFLAAPGAQAQDWSTFHGNLAAQKYSSADQITPENVDALTEAWEFHTGDVTDGSGERPATYFNSTPIYANDTLYIGTAFYRIVALNPATGEKLWSFDTDTPLKQLTQPGLKTRGVSYWEAENPRQGQPCQKRILMGTNGGRIYAVDADSGKACENFGQGGFIDINSVNDGKERYPLSVLQPPTIAGDQVFTGWSGFDFRYAEAPDGAVFAFDVRTGELNWKLELLPPELQRTSGTANVWTQMTVDKERELLFIPVSSPSPNYWGGNRLKPAPLATSVTAVDTETGEVVWSYQIVHHDIWDYDTNAAPTLVDVQVEGETVPALVQTTKQGLLFVLNRETGEPIWPIEERPVPGNPAKGDRVSPTQPVPTWPEPMVGDFPGVWWLADVVSLGGCSRMIDRLRNDGLYTPPIVAGEPRSGTLVWPSISGGIQWGGGAYNPETGVYVVNTSYMGDWMRLIPRDDYQAETSQNEQGGYSPMEGAPFGVQYNKLMNWIGMPCWKPPFGSIAAYDMASGEQLWKHPFGRSQRYGFYMPEAWGAPNIGGPAMTASGLIFIGAAMDGYVRALSTATGEKLWEDRVEAPAIANPAIYEHDGRQYVVFTAGGNQILKPDVSDQVIAYALPRD